MRAEQREHFSSEDCLKSISAYREFVRAELDDNRAVLDLGTGAGYGAIAVSELVEKVLATDADEEMLAVAQQTCERAGVANVEFRRMAAEHIELPDASVQTVQIRYSLHHFENAGKALLEASRVMKAGGQLLLSDAFFPSEVVQLWTITSLLRHGKWTPYFTYRQHMDMLAAAGLRVGRIRPRTIVQSLAEFYATSAEQQRPAVKEIIKHLSDRQRNLMHFEDHPDGVTYAYDGFDLVARK
jgi:ubiquinone/menaquinone biosynthesis C-methylase UbiE